jgi:hypothetical protein
MWLQAYGCTMRDNGMHGEGAKGIYTSDEPKLGGSTLRSMNDIKMYQRQVCCG